MDKVSHIIRIWEEKDMSDLILNIVLWTLALYGLIEIIKTIYYIFTYTNLQSDGIYMIIAVKNQEDKIEGFMRSILFRVLYGKEDSIKNIIVTDLNSKDNTKIILDKLSKDYDYIKCANWRECKELIDNIEKTNIAN